MANTTESLRYFAKPGWYRVHVETSSLLCTIVLGIVAYIVLQPILLLLINSFRVGDFGLASSWGLQNWYSALTTPEMREAIVNTLTLTVTSQGIAFVIGTPLAWLIARTNLPGKDWLEFGFWITFFLPTLTVMLGWILLLDGGYGLLNLLIVRLPFINEPPFEIFSWWGIVFTRLVTSLISIKVMLLTPALRNMDSDLEEASRTCGSSIFNTLFRVVLPLMLPAITVVMILGTIRSLESFEVELILGAPARIDVYSTLIYRYMRETSPEYGAATVLSVLVLLAILPFVLLQQWLIHRRNYVTLGGKYSGRLQALGRWRWPIFVAIVSILTVMGVIPFTLVGLSTFMKVFGYFNLPDPWTIGHWRVVLPEPEFLRSLVNSLLLGAGAAAVSMLFFPIIAYITVRTKYMGRGILEFITWLPTAIPGIVLSLGILWFFLMAPMFRPLYGTISILVIAITLARMTTGVQVLKSNMMQLGSELEEMSSVSGARWVSTFRRIVLPLMAPSVAMIGLLSFAAGVRNIGHVALLSTGAVQPLSVLQLNYLEDGSLEQASVVGVIIFLLIVGVAILARIIGLKMGASRG